MRNALVSVVVPVYNVEQYLRDCLESIINQTYTNLEIILVDDGSKDNSGVICDEYAQKDNRVVVLHQMNQGVACARKRGIEYANGEYLCFVDSDDKIKTGMVEFFLQNIEDCDLITAGVDIEKKNKEINIRFDRFEEGCYQTEKEMQYLLKNVIVFENIADYGLLPFLYTKMYKTQMAKEVISEIDERITFFEDREFLIRYVMKSRAVKVTKESFYTYSYRENSAVHSVKKTYMHNINLLYCALENAAIGHPLEQEIKRQLDRFVYLRLPTIPEHMGFDRMTQCIKYIFPYINLLEGKKYILYGAGKVGINYYRQIKKCNEGELVLWVDKQWEEYKDLDNVVCAVEKIAEVEYDGIILAVAKEELANQIKQELLDKGIPKEKIWWREPILLDM